MRALASSARSTAPEFSTFGISLSLKQWLSHKAVLDSDPGQWPGHHCGQWQHWQQCLSHRTRAVLSSAQAPHASDCHCQALLRSYGRSGAVLCGSGRALLRHRNQVYKCRFLCNYNSRWFFSLCLFTFYFYRKVSVYSEIVSLAKIIWI